MEEIVFVTHNKGKAKSAEKHFKNLKISTYDFELDEPRSDDLKVIISKSVCKFFFRYTRRRWNVEIDGR